MTLENQSGYIFLKIKIISFQLIFFFKKINKLWLGFTRVDMVKAQPRFLITLNQVRFLV
jgi:hypothetical protein